nr:immunoglobulin heavy chain junction region [Mus musculus]
CARHWDHFDYW